MRGSAGWLLFSSRRWLPMPRLAEPRVPAAAIAAIAHHRERRAPDERRCAPSPQYAFRPSRFHGTLCEHTFRRVCGKSRAARNVAEAVARRQGRRRRQRGRPRGGEDGGDLGSLHDISPSAVPSAVFGYWVCRWPWHWCARLPLWQQCARCVHMGFPGWWTARGDELVHMPSFHVRCCCGGGCLTHTSAGG